MVLLNCDAFEAVLKGIKIVRGVSHTIFLSSFIFVHLKIMQLLCVY